MPNVAHIIRFLEDFAPPILAESWDNTGLLIGRRSLDVKTVMTCLTLTPDVVGEAVQSQVDLIVTHHPVLFKAVHKLTDATPDGRIVLPLVEEHIAVYSPHTSFDSARNGINQQLAENLGLLNISPLLPNDDMPGVGAGRHGKLSNAVSLREFLPTLTAATGATYCEYNDAGSPVEKVAIACGAAAEFLDEAISHDCDTFITGEARFHAVLAARAQHINFVLLGHYSSERPAIESLVDTIGKKFPSLRVFASRQESDPLSVFLP